MKGSFLKISILCKLYGGIDICHNFRTNFIAFDAMTKWAFLFAERVVVRSRNASSPLWENTGTWSISFAPSARNLSWDIGIMRKKALLIARHIFTNFLATCASFAIKSSGEMVNFLSLENFIRNFEEQLFYFFSNLYLYFWQTYKISKSNSNNYVFKMSFLFCVIPLNVNIDNWIFPVFTALNKAWCVHHFACAFCDQNMNQKTKFFDFDLRPACKKCYEKFPPELRKRMRRMNDFNPKRIPA